MIIIIIGSRKNFCINSDVSSLGSDSKISEICLEMQKKSKKDKDDRTNQELGNHNNYHNYCYYHYHYLKVYLKRNKKIKIPMINAVIIIKEMKPKALIMF